MRLSSLLVLSGMLGVAGVSLLFKADVLSADDAAATGTTAEKVDFVRDVQPLLKRRCFKCHSADKREGGFRLDVRSAAFAGGDEGIAIRKGDSAASSFIKRVSGEDPDLVMPPEGDRLSAAEVDLLKRWIDQGAAWPDSAAGENVRPTHWSYQPVTRPDLPTVQDANWGNNEVDAFVLAKLEARGFKPSPQADRYTLIRRLYLDLLGLPPHPDEVDAFVNDDSPKAYDELVSRLLQSPHFGERWGRHWLDMARYADSDGYEKDRARPNAWRWRDWVIDAINKDVPFDQFTIEQLAGDLLPDATADQKLATAFHRQTLTNTEGGTDQEQWRVEACFDRTETTGTVWLGLTIGCARCHSHKYDAITQREYYQLFAFANNGDESNSNISISEEATKRYEAARKVHDEKLKMLETELAVARESVIPQFDVWEQDFHRLVEAAKDTPPKWRLLEIADLKVASGDTVVSFQEEDSSYLLEGPAPDKDEFTLTTQLPAASVSAIRLEVIPDKRLPGNGPGRASNGNFVLSDVRTYFGPTRDLKPEHAVKLVRATSDFAQDKFPPANAIDSDKTKTGWAISPQMGKPHHAEFFFEKPLTTASASSEKEDARKTETQKTKGDEGWLQIVLDQQYGGQHTIGRFRIHVRTGTDPADTIPEKIQNLLTVEAEDRNDTQQAELIDWFMTEHPETKKVLARIDAHKKAVPKKPIMSVRVINQRTSSPRTTYVFRRGEFLQPIKDQAVIPAGLSTLHPMKPRKETGDRLDLATWIVSPKNPLTPRVTVNHVWKHLFGEGIVRTVNDFGIRGEKPTHPELLDWLADEFRGNLGWSRKELIRTIVTSATYRQASSVRPELLDVDPQNLLLARQNRVRVEAEIVRDLSLSVSGLLSSKIGGPSVFPPLPPGVAELSYANNFKWATSKGEDRYRRGMYTFFKRTSPHPNLTLFDCPDSNLTCVSRNSSNTPLQALTLLNNEIFVEAARKFGKRVLNQKADDAARLTHAFQLCVSRGPSSSELDQFREMLDASRKWYGTHKDVAVQLAGLSKDSSTAKDEPEAAEIAAWIVTCRIMLNMDEFITRN